MPKNCPQCQKETADDSTFCPSCGSRLDDAPPAGPAPAPDASPPPPTSAPTSPSGSSGSSGSSMPAYKFDASRWSVADRIAGIASIVLFVSLFMSWFSVSLEILSYSWSGVSAHGYLYIVMIICMLEIAYLALRAGWDELPGGIDLPHHIVMIIATVANVVLVLIGFFDKPYGSGVGWSFGAVLALVAALVAAAPYTIPQLREKTT